MKALNDWQAEIRRKLDKIGDGVHCEQARLLAEYAAGIVIEKQLPDRQLRLDWLIAEAKRRHFNLELRIETKGVSYNWKQQPIRYKRVLRV
jgi:hypothetical protein